MYLVRLIYCSEVTENFRDSDLQNILDTSKIKNINNNITGILCFNNNYFLQCIEGSRSKVNELYQSIMNDRRHNNITILEYKEVVVRDFSLWTMGFLALSATNEKLIMKYSITPTFNPYKMSGESCLSLMHELKNTIKVI